ncbi:uncharacterized protein LTR77_003020 [Saxophila tyrrhenica]|uniref:RRM domain-containing protein n=1 Tax=Saxophila tyrrhenica TaxID=1690608 RepID=A0AAV9PGN1_9PEZI|nr:hypothetical protein LTR77_003020 [Saxophila tyrrhenica]
MSHNFGPRVPRDISAGVGPWFVQIWGDLKDIVRPAASHVGHVSVYANGRATITVRKLDEAVCCFEYLSADNVSGRKLYVELWETTPNRAPRLMWKNVASMPTLAAPAGKAQQPCPNQLSPPPVPTQQDVLAQQMASMQMMRAQQLSAYQIAYSTSSVTFSNLQQSPPSPVSIAANVPYIRAVQPQEVPRTFAPYTKTAPAAAPATRGPRYATGSSGIPTRVDRGSVRTEYRGVFVSNLSYDVKDSDIQRLFRVYGEITKLDHKREAKVNSKGKSTFRSRGNAIITFATSEQAQAAIEELDGSTWNDRMLAVRFDTEATPVDPPPRKSKKSTVEGGPLIVNGSTNGRKS